MSHGIEDSRRESHERNEEYVRKHHTVQVNRKSQTSQDHPRNPEQ